MTTPPLETPVAGETLEKIAKRIARKHVCGCHECKTDRAALETAMLSALRSERERCASVAEVIPDSKFDLDHEPARTEQQIRNDIARAIREGK